MKRTTFFLALLVFIGFIQAQSIEESVIGAAGSSNQQLSSTVGEPVTATVSNVNYTLTQGFHQGEFTITQVAEIPNDGISISLFPNPATDYVSIISNKNNLIYELLDGNSKVMERGIIENEKVTISLKNHANSTYYIRISSENNSYYKSYKLIKY